MRELSSQNRRRLSPARVLAPVLALVAALLPASAWPQGRWLDTRHDFGAFDEETGTVYTRFLLVNDGAAPISITDARANCGCTTPRYDARPVAPGDTAALTVGFDPSGRPGAFAKQVQATVADGDGHSRRTRLEIAGTVLGAANTLRSRYTYGGQSVRLRSRQLQLGDAPRPGNKAASLAGVNASRDTLRVSATGVPPYLTVAIQPKVVPPSGTFAVSALLDTEASGAWGLLDGTFTLLPDSLPVDFTALVREDFSGLTPQQMSQAPCAVLETQALDMGVMRRGAPARKTVRLTNAGRTPLLVRAAQASEQAVTVTAPHEVKPGRSAEIAVDVDPRLRPDAWLNARVTLITNDPMHPQQAVRVVGTIED